MGQIPTGTAPTSRRSPAVTHFGQTRATIPTPSWIVRIISQFRDYYDGVQRHGADPSCIYVRKMEKQEFAQRPRDWKLPSWPLGVGDGRNDYRGNRSHPLIVAFCGRLYPAIHVCVTKGSRSKVAICYSVAGVDDFLRRTLKPAAFDSYRTNKSRYAWPDQFLGMPVSSRVKMSDWFRTVKQQDAWCEDMQIKRRCPVILIEPGRNWHYAQVTWNPVLRTIGFQHVVDTTQAYQTIFRFLSNIAEDRKKMPVVSDELKAQAHGFDKHSFRKPDPSRVSSKK